MNAEMQGADLSNARLEGAHMQQAHLDKAILLSAQLQGAQLDGAFLNGARLQGARLIGTTLSRAQLREAHLKDAYISLSLLNEVCVRDADGRPIINFSYFSNNISKKDGQPEELSPCLKIDLSRESKVADNHTSDQELENAVRSNDPKGKSSRIAKLLIDLVCDSGSSEYITPAIFGNNNLTNELLLDKGPLSALPEIENLFKEKKADKNCVGLTALKPKHPTLFESNISMMESLRIDAAQNAPATTAAEKSAGGERSADQH